MDISTDSLSALASTYLVPLIWKLSGALAIWIIGGWVIGWLRGIFNRVMVARHMDATLLGYLDTSLGVLLKVVLAIAVLGVLGVETTSFAAILAAAGVAIGLAWSGLLANFAAGVFLMLLRPFKKGEMISAGGVTGEVIDIGLFATTLHTADNLKVFVGNNKLLSDNIINYSANPFRAVDLRAQIAHAVNAADAMTRLRARLATIPNVLATPAPVVEILEGNAMGTALIVRPFCANANYWQVYFDAQRAIAEVFAAANYPTPEIRQAVRAVS